MNKFTIIKDTREQEGWTFTKSDICDGMKIQKLDTGDYSIQGLESIFCVERKRNTSEFSHNICEKRFEDELLRMESFQHPFIILEFTMEDILNFPRNSGVPVKLWGSLKIKPEFILKRLLEYELRFKTKIILAGKNGSQVCMSLFKRMMELHG